MSTEMLNVIWPCDLYVPLTVQTACDAVSEYEAIQLPEVPPPKFSFIESDSPYGVSSDALYDLLKLTPGIGM